MKPHIWFRDGAWFCAIFNLPTRFDFPLGYGQTPAQAYYNWIQGK